MIIRTQYPYDYTAVLRLTYEAFLMLDYPGRRRMDEHYLIYLLQDSMSVISELSFVAEQDGKIVGHILYTKSEILHPDGTKTNTITFGPLSVSPTYHKRGIGSALVRYSMEAAREQGFGAVLITGIPEYYPKLGFKRSREYGLTLEDGTSPDAFMAYELRQGYLHSGGRLHFLAPEYDICETDDAGYQRFHCRFMEEYYPGELILRPFWEEDLIRLERWLYMSHVAQWYKYPEHRLREIRSRKRESGLFTHFMAEVNGVPIGFCQYDDSCFAKACSLDYLIGEPEYLHKGYGKEIVRQLTERVCSLGAKQVIVQPEEENIASVKTLEANGYKHTGRYYIKE